MGQQTEADNATTTANQATEIKMMDETEINNKRVELKKLWAIYIRRTKLVSNSKESLFFAVVVVVVSVNRGVIYAFILVNTENRLIFFFFSNLI